MPQATKELREKMRGYFGDPIDDGGPIKFLKSRGYKLTRGGLWEPKDGVTNYNDMEQKEYDALLFLVQEWDYGGLTTIEREDR